jgi:hypothetical protein
VEIGFERLAEVQEEMIWLTRHEGTERRARCASTRVASDADA